MILNYIFNTKVIYIDKDIDKDIYIDNHNMIEEIMWLNINIGKE